MEIVLVVAMSENRVIGRDGDLPWKISADLKHFKAVTMGHPIIMGRKTWDSIGRPLPGRENIVITRNPDFEADGVVRAPSAEEALNRCRDAGADKAMIIGGGQIYADVMDIADTIELTEVHEVVDGDTVFPEISSEVWREVARELHPPVGSRPGFSFVTLKRY